MGRKKASDAASLQSLNENTIRSICEAMSGVEWDGQLANQIADILYSAGFEIPDPDPERVPPACCPHCGKRDHLLVAETALVSHEYDAQRHTAARETETIESLVSNHSAMCSACGRTGTLTEYGMKLLGWTDGSEDDEDEEDDDGED